MLNFNKVFILIVVYPLLLNLRLSWRFLLLSCLALVPTNNERLWIKQTWCWNLCFSSKCSLACSLYRSELFARFLIARSMHFCLFFWYVALLLAISLSWFLGNTLGDEAFVRTHTAERAATAGDLLDALGELDDPQVALRLLRACAGFACMLHSMRCNPPTLHTMALDMFDGMVRRSFGDFTGLHLTASQWKQASLGMARPSVHFHIRSSCLPGFLGVDLAVRCCSWCQFCWQPSMRSLPPTMWSPWTLPLPASKPACTTCWMWPVGTSNSPKDLDRPRNPSVGSIPSGPGLLECLAHWLHPHGASSLCGWIAGTAANARCWCGHVVPSLRCCLRPPRPPWRDVYRWWWAHPTAPHCSNNAQRRPADVYLPTFAGSPAALDFATTAPQQTLAQASRHTAAAAEAYARHKETQIYPDGGWMHRCLGRGSAEGLETLGPGSRHPDGGGACCLLQHIVAGAWYGHSLFPGPHCAAPPLRGFLVIKLLQTSPSSLSHPPSPHLSQLVLTPLQRCMPFDVAVCSAFLPTTFLVHP